ncbi:hypothetical protein O3G_MSEX013226 [Manduca sexta]|uniref:Uncharacterized protein n=1 Tax=Manduca sexta TaxID=7130 RepID=A0A921ZRA2_MANSE|nr:hypothetical protein O3G_MSEX013226 [Manduca sexta]
MLPELLTVQEKAPVVVQTPADKKMAEVIRMDHNYSQEPPAKEAQDNVSRLNVRQLVDTLGYL